jgi:hypothetical protein
MAIRMMGASIRVTRARIRGEAGTQFNKESVDTRGMRVGAAARRTLVVTFSTAMRSCIAAS